MRFIEVMARALDGMIRAANPDIRDLHITVVDSPRQRVVIEAREFPRIDFCPTIRTCCPIHNALDLEAAAQGFQRSLEEAGYVRQETGR